MQVQVLFPAPKSGRRFVRIFMFVSYAEDLSNKGSALFGNVRPQGCFLPEKNLLMTRLMTWKTAESEEKPCHKDLIGGRRLCSSNEIFMAQLDDLVATGRIFANELQGAGAAWQKTNFSIPLLNRRRIAFRRYDAKLTFLMRCFRIPINYFAYYAQELLVCRDEVIHHFIAVNSNAFLMAERLRSGCVLWLATM